LIEQLFGKRTFAAPGRTYKQMKAGKDAVQSAVEIGKAAVPTRDLLDLLFLLQFVEESVERFAFGNKADFSDHSMLSRLAILLPGDKPHFSIDSDADSMEGLAARRRIP
jgi:hypothetical protein